MSKEKFLRSEAAVILAKNGVESPNLPGWITKEQRDMFASLPEDEKESILREDAIARGEISRHTNDDGTPIWKRS